MMSAIVLCVLFYFLSNCEARIQEPSCTYMDNLEKILEKTVRNEHKLSIFGDTLKAWETKLEAKLKNLDKAETEINKQIKDMKQSVSETFEKLEMDTDRMLETKESEISQTLTDALQKHKGAPQSLQDAFVGFSVRGTDALTGNEVTFTTVETNVGNRYDTSTGTFTCDLAGFYFFNLAVLKDSSVRYLNCKIRKNDQEIGVAHVNPGKGGTYFPASTTALVHLDVGDQVKTICNGETAAYQGYYSSFTGYLVHVE